MLEYLDYIRIILNDGRYQLRTVVTTPTWSGIEGEMVLYAAGTERGIFYYLNGQWNASLFAPSTGQNLIQLGSGDNIIYGDTGTGFWIGNAIFASAPFRVTMGGALTATSATITGAITASSGTIGGWTIGASSLTAGTGATSVGLAPGTYPFYAGHGTPTSAPFYVSNAGVIQATSGTIGGWILAATTLADNATTASAKVLIDKTNTLIRLGPTSGTYLTLDGANIRIRTSDYVSGVLGSGWNIDTSIAEFNNIRARGKISTSVFEKDVISSVGGNFLISDSDILNADMTALDASTLTILGDTTFAVNDILRIKDGVDDEWLLVTNIASAPTYTVTRDQAAAYTANANPIWKKGTAVVNFGASGEGLIYMTASETNAPHIDVVTHAGAPWTTLTTRMRIGNVNGFLGASSDLYGIYIGETNKYLKYDPTNGLQIKGIIIAESGSSVGSSNQLLRNGNFEIWSAGDSLAPDGWTLAGTDATIAKENTIIKLGTYSAKLTRVGNNCNINQSIHTEKGIAYWRDKIVTIGCWVYATGASRATLRINDGYGQTPSTYHTGDSTWQFLTVTRTISAVASELIVECVVYNGDTSAYFDGAMFIEGSVAIPFAEKNYSEQWIHPLDATLINGGNIYTGTVTADKITAGTFVGGSFVVGVGGTIQSSDYVADTTGFRLAPTTGLEVNTGTIQGMDINTRIMVYAMMFSGTSRYDET